jgi:hypothetical protein
MENALNVIKGAPQTGDVLFDPNLPATVNDQSHKDGNILLFQKLPG